MPCLCDAVCGGWAFLQPSRAAVDDNLLGVLCALVFVCVAAVQAPTASVPQGGGLMPCV